MFCCIGAAALCAQNATWQRRDQSSSRPRVCSPEKKKKSKISVSPLCKRSCPAVREKASRGRDSVAAFDLATTPLKLVSLLAATVLSFCFYVFFFCFVFLQLRCVWLQFQCQCWSESRVCFFCSAHNKTLSISLKVINIKDKKLRVHLTLDPVPKCWNKRTSLLSAGK